MAEVWSRFKHNDDEANGNVAFDQPLSQWSWSIVLVDVGGLYVEYICCPTGSTRSSQTVQRPRSRTVAASITVWYGIQYIEYRNTSSKPASKRNRDASTLHFSVFMVFWYFISNRPSASVYILRLPFQFFHIAGILRLILATIFQMPPRDRNSGPRFSAVDKCARACRSSAKSCRQNDLFVDKDQTFLESPTSIVLLLSSVSATLENIEVGNFPGYIDSNAPRQSFRQLPVDQTI
jgi:hypothetical protein